MLLSPYLGATKMMMAADVRMTTPPHTYQVKAKEMRMASGKA
jgi:hypothetical protein